MKLYLGLDIGGTHISGCLMQQDGESITTDGFSSFDIDASVNAQSILAQWVEAMGKILGKYTFKDLAGIGIAMPGPFDYVNGISLIKGLGKYEALYGMNIKGELKARMMLPQDVPVIFANDAVCFARGEYSYGSALGYRRVVALTLGTGLGAAFLEDGRRVDKGPEVPDGGVLYNIPYGNGIAEDCFSARGLLKAYRRVTGKPADTVKAIFERAQAKDSEALCVFEDFGRKLGDFLSPWLRLFDADCLVLGGGISKASSFFIHMLEESIMTGNPNITIKESALLEKASALGAADLLLNHGDESKPAENKRKTDQYLLPVRKPVPAGKGYDVYPAFSMEDGKIYQGIDTLAGFIATQKTVIIDGYAGIFWDEIKEALQHALPADKKVTIRDTRRWLLPDPEIESLVSPYLGDGDSVWGSRCDIVLMDLFDKQKVTACVADEDADINIIMGVGAALVGWDAPVIYFDLPKNELQFRMRAGAITNLGTTASDNEQMYKRFYFVDWVLLNKHKKSILNRISVVADSQRPGAISWMYADDLNQALETMSKNVFRVRPWFEPGAWGGQWIKEHIKGINKEVVNYAWSFELITPENGLLLESGGILLEVSFDFIMLLHGVEVLGREGAARFGDQFPIRFDFLDTIEGGNLSIQCHPSPSYIKKHFGEDFTQDETYYILEAEEEAGVYLGFQDGIDPVVFKEDLERSQAEHSPVEIGQYVQSFAAKKHDFFLIPHGTVHSAAAGNLVLEISATPYIFTFKMYDWLRLDLNGKPRPINIGHAFNNLDFNRKGDKVSQELISKPKILDSGEDWRLVHLPTHEVHFYDVYRYEFENRVSVSTQDSCNVLMLVEGTSVMVETKNGFRQRFAYAETFVIPAAAESYTLINEGKGQAKVLKAFLKSGI